MKLRPLGDTGLYVTPIGLGLAALGRPAYINIQRDRDLGRDRSVATMERRCHDMLDAAYAAGVRYVDVARSYGFAEQFLASWLDACGVPAGSLAVGSKWGYEYVGGWQIDAPTHERKELTLEMLRRQLPESRRLLGEHLGLYQIHSATLESGVLEDPAVLGELSRLRAEGLAIGLTVSGPEQGAAIARALEVQVDGVNPFGCVQATWNLLETSAGPALAAAKARGWGVIVKEALANGRLARPAGDDLAAFVSRAASRGESPAAFAMAAALSRPWADVVLSGAVTPAQLQSHLAAIELSADDDDWPQIAESPHAYWSRRGSLRWH